MRLTSLIGENITAENGRRQGYVIRALTDDNRLTALVCADENEREFTVDFATVRQTEGGLKFSAYSRRTSGRTLRCGLPCFDENAAFLGSIEDYIVKGKKVCYALVGHQKLPIALLVQKDAALLRPLQGEVGKRLQALSSGVVFGHQLEQ